MATKKISKKSFQVSAKIRAEVGLHVEADSLEDALEYARTLKITDYITFNGEHNDSDNPEIISVWES